MRPLGEPRGAAAPSGGGGGVCVCGFFSLKFLLMSALQKGTCGLRGSVVSRGAARHARMATAQRGRSGGCPPPPVRRHRPCCEESSEESSEESCEESCEESRWLRPSPRRRAGSAGWPVWAKVFFTQNMVAKRVSGSHETSPPLRCCFFFSFPGHESNG